MRFGEFIWRYVLDKIKIDRISELTRISRERELTESEKEERAQLRCEYIESIKTNFRATLENIKYTDEEE